MKIKFVKASKVSELKANISENLDSYRSGDFEFLVVDSNYFFDSEIEVDLVQLQKISVEGANLREKDNCMHMYKSISGMNSYIAREERLWVGLTHSLLLDYTRDRWPIPDDDEKAIKHIMAHFFCNGARGFERDNSASRLWWLAHLCKRVEGISFEKALECLLHQSDVRANIIERPTLSQNPELFSQVIRTLNDSFEGDQKLFGRSKFRSFMKNLNVEGGMVLLSTLPQEEVRRVLGRCV